MANPKTACKEITEEIVSVCNKEGVKYLTLEKIKWDAIVKPILEDTYENPKNSEIYKLMIKLENALKEPIPVKDVTSGAKTKYILDSIKRTEKIVDALKEIWDHSKTWLRFGVIQGAFNGVGTPSLWKSAHTAVVDGLKKSIEIWEKEEEEEERLNKERQKKDEILDTDFPILRSVSSGPSMLEFSPPPSPPPPPPMPEQKILTEIETLLKISKESNLSDDEVNKIENEAKEQVNKYFSTVPKGVNEKKKINIAWMKKYVSTYHLNEHPYPKENEYFYAFISSYNKVKKLVFEKYNSWYNHVKENKTKNVLKIHAAIKVTKATQKLDEAEQDILKTEFKLRSEFLDSLRIQIGGGQKTLNDLKNVKKSPAFKTKSYEIDEEAIKKSNLPDFIKESLTDRTWVLNKEAVNSSWFSNLNSFISAEDNRQTNEKTLKQIKEDELGKLDKHIQTLEKEIEELGKDKKETEQKKKEKEKNNVLALQKRVSDKYKRLKTLHEKDKPVLSEENLKILRDKWLKVTISIYNKLLPSLKELEDAYGDTKNIVKPTVFNEPTPKTELFE